VTPTMTTERPDAGDEPDSAIDDLMDRLRELPSRVHDALGTMGHSGEITAEHAFVGADLPDLSPPVVDPTPAAPIPVVRIDDFDERTAATAEPSGSLDAGAPEAERTSGDAPGPPRAGIDPRIRARRIEVARAQGRRRLRLLIALAVVVVLAVSTILVLHSPLFSVDRVQVNGAVYTDPATVAAVVGSLRGQAVLSVDLGKVKRVLEASPWVRRATATRSWPRGITIDIVEREPAASYPGEDGQWRVIDTNGRVLASLDGKPRDLVQIIGPQDAVDPGGTAPAKLVDGAQVVNAIPPTIKPMVDALRIDGAGGVGLTLELRTKAHTRIVIGTSDQVEDKFVTLLALLHRVDIQKVDAVDLRVPNRAVCLPAIACQALTGKTP